MSKTKVIALASPTASGKTKYAIQLAKRINGEIISADSRQVYKGFDIATAKPTVAEREGIAHYLIDVAEPESDFSVADFYDNAKIAIAQIVSKGKTPIVVGGTGLYFRILLEDYELPRVSADYELRETLEKLSCEELYERISALAPQLLERVHINNKVRLIRTLEMAQNGACGGRKECEYDVEWIGLKINREELYERINTRVDEMLHLGLVDETRDLLSKHGRIKNLVSTIGYREIIQYFDGIVTYDEAINKIKQSSRNYAKRQLTWFRRNPALGFEYV